MEAIRQCDFNGHRNTVLEIRTGFPVFREKVAGSGAVGNME